MSSKNINRRDFLKKSAAVGGLVAIMGSLNGCATINNLVGDPITKLVDKTYANEGKYGEKNPAKHLRSYALIADNLKYEGFKPKFDKQGIMIIDKKKAKPTLLSYLLVVAKSGYVKELTTPGNFSSCETHKQMYDSFEKHLTSNYTAQEVEEYMVEHASKSLKRRFVFQGRKAVYSDLAFVGAVLCALYCPSDSEGGGGRSSENLVNDPTNTIPSEVIDSVFTGG